MTSQKELVFFVESNSEFGNHSADLVGKYPRTYMNRFTISEDDQFEISNVHILDSSFKQRDLQKTDCVIQSIERSNAVNLDLLFFELHEVEGRPNDHLDQQKHLCNKIRSYCLKNVNNRNLRMSFIEMDIEVHPGKSRTGSRTVSALYGWGRPLWDGWRWRISLNNDLEAFHRKCKSRNNRFSKNEVAFFFHAELLSTEEFEAYHEQTKILETQEYHLKLEQAENWFLKTTKKNNQQVEFESSNFLQWQHARQRSNAVMKEVIAISNIDEFYLYRGVRKAIVLHPQIPQKLKVYTNFYKT